MTANLNQAPTAPASPQPQLTNKKLSQLSAIAERIAAGHTISYEDCAEMATHFAMVTRELRYHRRNVPALIHRVRTACAQENVNPAALLGSELGNAAS